MCRLLLGVAKVRRGRFHSFKKNGVRKLIAEEGYCRPFRPFRRGRGHGRRRLPVLWQGGR
jgi:hypothetical protein